MRVSIFRARFAAAVWDPCGRASGSFQATGGHGEFTNTKYAKLGDMGSKLPKFPSGAVWKAGSVVETMWSLRTNHVRHLAPLRRWPAWWHCSRYGISCWLVDAITGWRIPVQTLPTELQLDGGMLPTNAGCFRQQFEADARRWKHHHARLHFC